MTQKAMHMQLMEVSGKLFTCDLPAVSTGKYVFSEKKDGSSEIPLYITAEEEGWVLHGTGGAEIYRGEESLGRESVLNTDDLFGVRFSGRCFVLYGEEAQENDGIFVHYRPCGDGTITIGRNQDNTIYYENRYVGRHHAELKKENGRWTVEDLQSINGTFVNGSAVRKAELRTGDSIRILGLTILIGAGFLAINNARGRFKILDSALKQTDGQDAGYEPLPEKAENGYFNRHPRRKFKLEPEPIEISMPPAPMQGSKIPLMLRLSNPALMGARALAGGNALMAVSSMVLPFATQGVTEKDRADYEQRRFVKYMEYLEKKSRELLAERDNEEQTLNSIYPPMEEVLQFPDNKRLWEWRKSDPDFLTIRIGTGSMPLLANIQYSEEEMELDEDPLRDEMLQLVRNDFSIPDAPVLLPLRESFITGIEGTRTHAEQIAANMITGIALTHSYDEVKIVILGREKDTENIRREMTLFRYLPHCWNNDRDFRLLAETKEDAIAVSEYLGDQLKTEENTESRKLPACAYVVFAFSRDLLECCQSLDEVIGADEYRGASVITVFGDGLKESQSLIRMEKRTGTLMNMNEPEDKDRRFTMEKANPEAFRSSMTKVMHTRLRIEGKAYALPKSLSFLDMLGVGKLEYLNLQTRWQNNNPAKSLEAPIGIGADGGLFYLDLHQKRQGPHGLVAGMTGSGKSEFIITYILSLAVNYSPEEVAFVLIDYKGGGLATAFDDPSRGIHLPHVVGTITNLDGAAIQRSLTSIQSELKRRQRVFNEAKSLNNEGTMDIYDYQRLYRARKVPEPMPHLFLIADEFAELKKQQPEFMDALISTARIGRSLGVHLILATQKPAGVVNDQIWSNSRFRICLKVQDRGDSMEMIKRPDGAAIKETGRFYLQVGYDEYFAMGQAAWAGADYIPREEVTVQGDESIDFLDNTGQVALNCKEASEKKASDKKQLVAIVEYLTEYAKEKNIAPQCLWMPPLGETISLEIPRAMEDKREYSDITALIGVIDDPEKQQQHPLRMDLLSFRHGLICGNAGSGKSTQLRTMLYELSRAYTPEEVQYYILDLSGGALNVFRDMPHCGAYLTEQDGILLDQLMDFLRSEIRRRKALFEEADVTSFQDYLAKRRIPLILFVIDGYSNMSGLKQGVAFNNELYVFLREAASFGVKVILSVNHLNEVHSKAKAEIDYRIALQAKDRYDYTDILEKRTMLTAPNIPGRGLCVYEDAVLEYHTAIPCAEVSEEDRNHALRETMKEIAKQYAGMPGAARLPEIDRSETFEDFCAGFRGGRMPLGRRRETTAPVAVPLKQFYKMAVYFGNPKGCRPVWTHLLYDAMKENMRVTVLRRQSNSLFLTKKGAGNAIPAPEDMEILDTGAETAQQFNDMLTEEVVRRNVFLGEYCEANGIPLTDKSRAVKAAGYMREKTRPWLVIIESLADLILSGAPEDILESLRAFFTRARGYNIYFIGAVYPEDADRVSSNLTLRTFCQEQFLLLFGGHFEKQTLVSSLPSEIRTMKIPETDFGTFVMRYREEYYNMFMPCGGYVPEEDDPDDAAII